MKEKFGFRDLGIGSDVKSQSRRQGGTQQSFNDSSRGDFLNTGDQFTSHSGKHNFLDLIIAVEVNLMTFRISNQRSYRFLLVKKNRVSPGAVCPHHVFLSGCIFLVFCKF
jgi:hypothetical protein